MINKIFFLLAFALIAVPALAQDQEQFSKPVERLYMLPYDSVWNAMKATVLANQYPIVVEKKRDGQLETNVLMLVKTDSVEDIMGKYGELPFIASADWEWGESMLKCRLKQVDSVMHLSITAQLRAFDNHTTSKWQYFASNGKIENALFDEVEKRLGR
jgi:hypothetical protein